MPDPIVMAEAFALAAFAGFAVMAALAWRARRGEGAEVSPTGAGWLFALGLGYYLGCWVLDIRPDWRLREDLDRLLGLVMPAAILVEGLGAIRRVSRRLVWGLRLVVAGLGARVLLHGTVYLAGPHDMAWTTMQAGSILGGIAAAEAAVWIALVTVVRRAAGVPVLLALATALGAAGLTVMLSSYVSGGQAALPMAAALGGAAVVAMTRPATAQVEAPIGLAVVTLASVLVLGGFFGTLRIDHAAILGVSPLLAAVPLLPGLRRLPPWARGLLGVLLVALAAWGVAAEAARRFASPGPEIGGRGLAPSQRPSQQLCEIQAAGIAACGREPAEVEARLTGRGDMMTQVAGRFWLALAVGIGGSSATLGADRTADQMVKDLDAIQLPKLDSSKAQLRSYMQSYRSKFLAAAAKRDALALELFKVAPDHERLPELMAERWSRKDERYRGLHKEVEDVLTRTRNPKLKVEAVFVKARARIKETRSKEGGSPDLTLMEEFLKAAPGDARGADLLQSAIDHTRDQTKKAALHDRLLRDFPDSKYASRLKGPREPREWIGKPFDLEFREAVTGAPISMKNLKGKVVVIDFWATWCGPCVAEMPRMKELYARYRERGVEFIGVSLDQPAEQGGLEKLKAFVKENKIAWPQYYQGNGWKSEFSESWSIHSIPRVFVVDQAGKLHSVDARGKLDTIIPALLDRGLAANLGN